MLFIRIMVLSFLNYSFLLCLVISFDFRTVHFWFQNLPLFPLWPKTVHFGHALCVVIFVSRAFVPTAFSYFIQNLSNLTDSLQVKSKISNFSQILPTSAKNSQLQTELSHFTFFPISCRTFQLLVFPTAFSNYTYLSSWCRHMLPLTITYWQYGIILRRYEPFFVLCNDDVMIT